MYACVCVCLHLCARVQVRALAPVGVLLMALVASYHGGVLLLLAPAHPAIARLWRFVTPLSVLMVLPDWILASLLNVLVFPADGAPRIGAVPVYMAGMWTIPLLLLLAVALRVEERGHGVGAAYAAAGVTALVLFGGSEAVLWPIAWHCKGVATVGGHAAVYILAPEAALGIAALYGYRHAGTAPLLPRLAAALAIMQLYIGAAVSSFFLLERVVRISG
jgi:hypothetical protein